MLFSFKDSWSVKHKELKANSLADNLKTCVCQARKQNRFIWGLFKWNQLKCLTPSRSAKRHREFFVEGIHWLVCQTNACLNNHSFYSFAQRNLSTGFIFTTSLSVGHCHLPEKYLIYTNVVGIGYTPVLV
jgi:hypothetical protein